MINPICQWEAETSGAKTYKLEKNGVQALFETLKKLRHSRNFSINDRICLFQPYTSTALSAGGYSALPQAPAQQAYAFAERGLRIPAEIRIEAIFAPHAWQNCLGDRTAPSASGSGFFSLSSDALNPASKPAISQTIRDLLAQRGRSHQLRAASI